MQRMVLIEKGLGQTALSEQMCGHSTERDIQVHVVLPSSLLG